MADRIGSYVFAGLWAALTVGSAIFLSWLYRELDIADWDWTVFALILLMLDQGVVVYYQGRQ